jgi:hypothetical protein
MGYLTEYSLEIIEGDTSIDHEKEITKTTDYADWGSCFEGEIKWYSHDEDMEKYSRKYPDTVFRLEGHGEESGDIWVKYFKNGKMHYGKAKIVFDEYDESKLK